MAEDEGSEGMVHEPCCNEQARLNTCAEYRDIFLRKRSVCEGAHIFRRQAGVGRGEEECSKAERNVRVWGWTCS
jgi:hypothetical protein